MELGMEFTADAIEHSEVVEANGELRFTTPREFSIAMKEADINQAVRQIIGKPLKIKVTIGDVAAQIVPQIVTRSRPRPPRRKTMCRAARSRIRKCRTFGICSAERSARFAT
jgi:hypothetical protein